MRLGLPSRRPRLPGVIALLLLSALCGCGGRVAAPAAEIHTAPVSEPAWQQGLPAPAQLVELLPRGRRASLVDADVVRSGNAYNAALPSQRVSASGGLAVFDPDYAPAGSFADLAFCMYSFDVPDYDRNPALRYGWNAAPAQLSNCVFGLSNWDAGRWDFYPCEADGNTELASLEPYFDFGGGLIAVVLVAGTTGCELSSLRLGTLPPTAAFVSDPALGLAPQEVQFDAAASTDLDGTLDSFEWDFDGDGTVDFNGGSAPLAAHTYDTGGLYNVRLRVTDNHGARAEVVEPLTVSGEWARSWGSAELEGYHGVAADAAGNVFVCGVTPDGLGEPHDVIVARYTPLGAQVWARRWGGAEQDLARDMDLDPEGNLIVCGQTASYGSAVDLFVQKWSPAGELLWSRIWGGAGGEEGTKVLASASGIYVGGFTYSYGAGVADALLLCLDNAGNFQWARTWGGTLADGINDMTFDPALLSDTTLAIAGNTSSFGDSAQAVFLRYSLDGALLNELVCGGAGIEAVVGVVGSVFGPTLLCGSFGSGPGGGQDIMLLSANPGVPDLAVSWGRSDADTACDLVYGSNGELWLSGYSSSFGGNHDLLLLRFDSSGLILGAEHWDDSDGFDEALQSAPYLSGGLLISGVAGSVDHGAWSSTSGVSGSPALTWVDPDGAVSSPSALTVATPLGTSALSGGVFDTGAGSGDCLIMQHRPGSA